ncbi:hypothetical protein GDO78_004998 [Eleutherodactylus coqui]|uniref:Uncharacterized protein n=1 Tax=Eleutherodactylus coqui TaxID=57060 RepID=A0A8J6FJ82_ELECQ|nr:hypothetical protein GDO78_004998 [Eleutherodactylus coqui]
MPPLPMGCLVWLSCRSRQPRPESRGGSRTNLDRLNLPARYGISVWQSPHPGWASGSLVLDQCVSVLLLQVQFSKGVHTSPSAILMVKGFNASPALRWWAYSKPHADGRLVSTGAGLSF